MSEWIPLLIAGPLAAAALITALHRFTPQAVSEVLAGSTALAVAAGMAALTVAARDGPIVVWAGGWTPREDGPVGVALTADSLGAGFGCLIAFLVFVVIVVARLYYVYLYGLFHALLMVFLGGTAGYCLTGDLFNLYVFFELIGVTAFVLTAFRMEEEALHGAMTFAVVNSLASILLLGGLGVLYAATGSVNLLELALAVPESEPRLVRLSLVLVMSGFLIKSAAVPFHFWVTDAYSGAAAPVCVLFGGASVTLGAFGMTRILWTVFGIDPPADLLSPLLLGTGLVTALYPAAVALVEPNLKRVLALTTVSHVGVLLIAIGMLSAQGLAGGASYLIGHALVKAGLFVCAAVLVLRAGSASRPALAEKRRDLVPTAVMIGLGGLLLADFPASAIHFGKSQIQSTLTEAGRGALYHAMTLSAVLAGAAVLSAAFRIVAGGREVDRGDARGHPRALLAVAVALFALAAAAAHPRLAAGIAHAAEQLVHGTAPVSVGSGARESVLAAGAGSWLPLENLLPPAAALLISLTLLQREHSRPALRFLQAPLRFLERLHRLHSGDVGDYVAWSAIGIALIALAAATL